MNLFHQFAIRAPNKVFLAIVLGALAGVSYAMLIPIAMTGIADDTSALTQGQSDIQRLLMLDVNHPKFAAVFFALCVVILCARTISQLLLIDVSIGYTADLRIQLYTRILRAAVPVIDRLGLPKLNAVLTEDVRRVVWGARLLPDILVNLVTVVGMLSFLFYLSRDSFWFVLKVLVIGVVTYQIPVFIARKQFNVSRGLSDGLHEGIRGLIQGIKDLKLDARKRGAYLSGILHAREMQLAQSDKRAFTTMALANNYGDLISFFVIGTVAFIFVNYHSMSTSELVEVVMVLLYLSAPVAGILAIAPQIAMGRVSLKRIEEMVNTLTQETSRYSISAVPEWGLVRFKGVRYRHEGDNGDGFTVGPVEFALRRGEITFIVGGNGSGKSTLGKLLSLHYRPQQGEILFGETAVSDETLESVRQEIAAIYSDYYLFDRLLGDIDPGTIAQARFYLRALGLDHKVGIDGGKFSTLALSDGQKRRVALLVAFMENKNLYIFDEWAADQDPDFKDTFYRTVLPELKARGKCVIVISHDDRYFGLADRILTMENGHLIANQPGGLQSAHRGSLAAGQA
jgi:putative pyoverdin transport system ATP-binding/permease protein